MALDPRYIVASDLESYFVDKDSGLPLAEGTLTFFRDNSRNTPKTVYQLSGSPPDDYTYVALPNPITLSSVGTVQNAGGDNVVIYYFPFDENDEVDLYYVVVRDSNGVEQFSREAWPNLTSGDDPTTSGETFQNQISNPQFTQILINEDRSTTYTVSAATNQVFEFAPNWDFVISGTGTVIVQRIVTTGNENIATSPPYVLDVDVSSGVSECFLRQRFSTNSGLWASTNNRPIFLSGVIVARNQDAGTTGLQMFYDESTGGSPIIIVDDSFDNTEYKVLVGVTESEIPASTNTDSGEDGYIDIYISFLAGTNVRLSSIQVVPTTSSAGPEFINYTLNSSNREQAFMGDYFLPRLNYKQIPSLLIGWDFTLNPFQFGATGNIAATAGYLCDQTIALRGGTGNVAFARNSVTSGLQLTTAGTNDAFYIMQYLTGNQAKKILGTRLSVNVFSYVTSVSDDVTVRVYLFRGSSSASIPSLPTSIGTVATSGVFTLSASNWTEISRSGLGTATATLGAVASNNDINTGQYDYGFSGWEITDNTQIGNTDKFAIVVTFGYVDASTIVNINSISVVPGDIPTRPAVQSFSDTVRDCQYFYEKSYELGTLPATATSENVFSAIQDTIQVAPNTTLCVSPFYLKFKTIKINSDPTITFYNENGTLDRGIARLFYNGSLVASTSVVMSTKYSQSTTGSDGSLYDPNDASLTANAAVNLPSSGNIRFHYVVDARLGIV